jgi:ketosteroid isomerase-like protein
MSQENVEIVKALFERLGEGDFTLFARDDDMWAAWSEAAVPFLHQDVESVGRDPVVGGTSYLGLDGLRAMWLDWVAPWVTWRATVEEVIDLGDRVLVLSRAFGLLEGSRAEVEATGVASVWTVRDGKIARVEFYAVRADALEAVGLSEQDAHADSS